LPVWLQEILKQAASADQNIVPFAKLIREEMSLDWAKEPATK